MAAPTVTTLARPEVASAPRRGSHRPGAGLPNDNGYVGSVNKADGYMLDLGDSDVDFVPYRED